MVLEHKASQGSFAWLRYNPTLSMCFVKFRKNTTLLLFQMEGKPQESLSTPSQLHAYLLSDCRPLKIFREGFGH